MQQRIKEKALELLQSGVVNRVLGWKNGEFFYDLTPAVFETADQPKYEPLPGPAYSRSLTGRGEF